jgi:hypothetical protein
MAMLNPQKGTIVYETHFCCFALPLPVPYRLQ